VWVMAKTKRYISLAVFDPTASFLYVHIGFQGAEIFSNCLRVKAKPSGIACY